LYSQKEELETELKSLKVEVPIKHDILQLRAQIVEAIDKVIITHSAEVLLQPVQLNVDIFDIHHVQVHIKKKMQSLFFFFLYII
jgi:hypothetical protein